MASLRKRNAGDFDPRMGSRRVRSAGVRWVEPTKQKSAKVAPSDMLPPKEAFREAKEVLGKPVSRPRAGRAGSARAGKCKRFASIPTEAPAGPGPVVESFGGGEGERLRGRNPQPVVEHTSGPPVDYEGEDGTVAAPSAFRAAAEESVSMVAGKMTSEPSRKDRSRQLEAQMDSGEGPEELLDQDKLRLLYLISLYTRDNEDRENLWVRSLPLLVIVYEGIIKGVFDYDYAPTAARVAGKRRYLNVSQEGRDDVDDLRELDFAHALKLTSERYQSQIAVRISPLGERYLDENLDYESKLAVDELAFQPASESPSGEMELLHVKWDPEEEKFAVVTDAGPVYMSTITDIEAVSYVSSPYLPESLRTYYVDLSSNADRVDELQAAITNIKDELSENLTLDFVYELQITEWVPMGGNQIVALNDKLGSSERVQGGFFTAMVDEAPDSTQFRGQSEGLSAVNLLDYDETAYVNFEAEVYFPSEEGIVQVENFGIHFGENGMVLYGLYLDAIMDRINTNLSLDLLSRLLVDVHEDSSKVVANLLSGHQRSMLDLVFLNDAENRDKFTVVIADQIHPKMEAEKYMDKEDNENELKQVIGDTYYSEDLSDEELMVMGKFGVLCAGAGAKRHEAVLTAYAGLQARNIFMRSVFIRCFILADVLLKARRIIDTYECNPESMNIIRETLSECTEDCITLGEIQVFLLESCDGFDVPQPLEDDPASGVLCGKLRVGDLLVRIRRRAVDVEKTIEGCRNELDALREMANVISEAIEMRTQEGLEQNTKNLEDNFRASARNSTSLEIINVVFAGTLAFDVVDRMTGSYMSIADDIAWVQDYINPYAYRVPMVWLIMNMGMWGFIGTFLIFLMRYAARMGSAVESSRMKLNQTVDLERLHAWLDTKNVTTKDLDLDSKSFSKKYTWVEDKHSKWRGMPPKVEMMVDERYSYILQVFLQINTRRSQLSTLEAKEFLFEELDAWGCLDVEEDDTWTTRKSQRRGEGTDEAASSDAPTHRSQPSAYEVEEVYEGEQEDGEEHDAGQASWIAAALNSTMRRLSLGGGGSAGPSPRSGGMGGGMGSAGSRRSSLGGEPGMGSGGSRRSSLGGEPGLGSVGSSKSVGGGGKPTGPSMDAIMNKRLMSKKSVG